MHFTLNSAVCFDFTLIVMFVYYNYGVRELINLHIYSLIYLLGLCHLFACVAYLLTYIYLQWSQYMNKTLVKAFSPTIICLSEFWKNNFSA